jgi:hypothetical protein
MRELLIEIVAMAAGTVMMEGGIVVPIVEFIDADGDELLPEDYELAVAIIAGTDEYGFFEVSLGLSVTVH